MYVYMHDMMRGVTMKNLSPDHQKLVDYEYLIDNMTEVKMTTSFTKEENTQNTDEDSLKMQG